MAQWDGPASALFLGLRGLLGWGPEPEALLKSLVPWVPGGVSHVPQAHMEASKVCCLHLFRGSQCSLWCTSASRAVPGVAKECHWTAGNGSCDVRQHWEAHMHRGPKGASLLTLKLLGPACPPTSLPYLPHPCLWACGGCGNSDVLWIAVGIIFPFGHGHLASVEIADWICGSHLD